MYIILFIRNVIYKCTLWTCHECVHGQTICKDAMLTKNAIINPYQTIVPDCHYIYFFVHISYYSSVFSFD